jgi:hypothetical protein
MRLMFADLPERGPDAELTAPASPRGDDRERIDTRCGWQHGGTMGDPRAAYERRAYGILGPADDPDPHLARSRGSNECCESRIGLAPLEDPFGGQRDAPIAPWGRDDALGVDTASARGNVGGDVIGASFGTTGAEVESTRRCPTCGDYGRGPWNDHEPTGGGATGTEAAAR